MVELPFFMASLQKASGVCVYAVEQKTRLCFHREQECEKALFDMRRAALHKICTACPDEESAVSNTVYALPLCDDVCFLAVWHSALFGLPSPILLVTGPYLCNQAVPASLGWTRTAFRRVQSNELICFAQMMAPTDSVHLDTSHLPIKRPNWKFERFSSAQLELIETERIEINQKHELEMLQCVTRGDLQKLETLCDTRQILDGQLPGHIRDYGLRTLKNLRITFNSLACRAAERGGLPPVYARCMCAHLSDLIERCETPQELALLSDNIFMRYCEKVAQCKESGYSERINQVVFILRADLCGAPSLAQMAKHLSVSAEHLSRQIKQETGKSYTKLRNEMRLEEAQFHLSAGNISVVEVAELSGFHSATQMCRVFREVLATTPLQWRACKQR